MNSIQEKHDTTYIQGSGNPSSEHECKLQQMLHLETDPQSDSYKYRWVLNIYYWQYSQAHEYKLIIIWQFVYNHTYSVMSLG